MMMAGVMMILRVTMLYDLRSKDEDDDWDDKMMLLRTLATMVETIMMVMMAVETVHSAIRVCSAAAL